MTTDRRSARSFWVLAAALIAVFSYVVATNNASATTVPAPYGCNGATETVAGNTGTAGDDIIIGTPGPETLQGLGGNDLLCGRGGGDALYGGVGNDRLEGQDGPDRLYGGPGNDHLVPTAGDTVVNGNDGSDCTPSGGGTSIEYPCPQASTTSSSTSTTACIPPVTGPPICT
jgi:Ca2+-binding RTX toxin-like protein